MNPFYNPILKRINSQNPLVVADVGAANGINQPWLQYTDMANVLCFGFEPFPPNFDALKPHNKVKYFPYAISSNVGERVFWGNSTEGFLDLGNNNEKEIDARFKKIIVHTETLDNLCNEKVLPPVDIIKIDSEGHEAYVLEGAARQLEKNTLFVKAEFTFRRNMASSLHRIGDILGDKGFIPFGISYGYSLMFNALGQGNVLHLKDISSILSLSEEKEHIKIMVCKLISICLLINNINYAFFCLKESRKKDLFSSPEYNLLYDTITEICFAPALVLVKKSKIRFKLCKLSFLLCHLIGGEMSNLSTPKDNSLLKSNRLFFKSRFLQKRNSQYLEKIYKSYTEKI